jgi:hypothetical protein
MATTQSMVLSDREIFSNCEHLSRRKIAGFQKMAGSLRKSTVSICLCFVKMPEPRPSWFAVANLADSTIMGAEMSSEYSTFIAKIAM